jgi:hypothetical protein
MTMKNHKYQAFLLSAVLLMNSMPQLPVMAADAEADIVIKTAQELAAFSRSCTNQEYTEGRTVSLQADINLSGSDFEPIPAFFGTFEGNGYTISGLDIRQSGSNMGLFRYVEEGALIQDLNVNGTVEPDGSRSQIGGIAGTNRGTIRNCTFSGNAEALESLGGIAGYNEENGLIESCTNYAGLTGNRQIGGVTGTNDGTVRGSINEGEINTTSDGIEVDTTDTSSISMSMDLDADREELRKQLQTERVNDVGGIAGLSTGTLQRCMNYGDVGYASTGYNVGGVAGRQSGLMVMCENRGEIAGRKDVGGIAGQLEPLLSIEYGDSTLDQMSDIMDSMLDTKDSMFDEIQKTSNNTTDRMDRMDEILKEIKNLTRDTKSEQRQQRIDYDEKANKRLDEIDTVLANMDLDLDSRKAERSARAARGNVSKIRELLGQLAGGDMPIGVDDDPAANALEMLNYYYGIVQELESNASDLVGNSEDAIRYRYEGVVDGIYDFEDQCDELRVATKDFLDLTRDYKDQLVAAVEGTDDDVTVQLDELYREMDDLSDQLKDGRSEFREERDTMDAQIRDMQGTIQDGRDRLKEERDDLTDHDKDLFEDVSAESTDYTDGVIMGCTNSGKVASDYQGGGIVGTIGIEMGTDPEEDIDTYGDKSIYVSRYAMASVRECHNSGEVVVQKDYAGGIVGAAWLGAVSANQNYGDIETVDGDYAGGIAGSSQATITDSYSMCDVTGNDYTGGIAGAVKIAKNNCAMVTIETEEDSEWYGSIAGGRNKDDELSGNIYVETGMGAVDNVTRLAEAEGITYEELLERDGLPDEFYSMHVTFLVDDEPVKQLICSYGQAVDSTEIPEVPKKAGFYENWEDVDLSDIRRNYKVHAVYQPWVNTIAVSDDPMPELLAEAQFMPDASLTLQEIDTAELKEAGITFPSGAKRVKAYRYEAADPQNPNAPETVTLHVLSGGASGVGLVTENGLQEIAARKDGKYLMFEASASGEYVLWHTYPVRLIGGVVIAMILAVLILLVKKHGAKKTGETNKEE